MTWIYLPNLACSAEQAADCLPQPTFSDGGPCAMSNGIGTRSRSSKPESGTDTCTTPRYGTTPAPSTGDPGLDSWMCSLRDFRASLSVLQERDSRRTTPAMGGPQPSEAFAKYDPDSACWRTFQVSFLNHTLAPYSENFPKRGIVIHGIAYRRRKSARTTSGKDSGLWPTPRAKESGEYQYSQGDHSKPVLTLLGKVRANPARTAGTNSTMNYLGSMAVQTVKRNMCPTPTVDDADNSTLPRSQIKRDSVVGAVMREGSVNGGQLNPNWVEWLMGYPIGWTALEPLGMDKFRQWLEKHGEG